MKKGDVSMITSQEIRDKLKILAVKKKKTMRQILDEALKMFLERNKKSDEQ